MSTFEPPRPEGTPPPPPPVPPPPPSSPPPPPPPPYDPGAPTQAVPAQPWTPSPLLTESTQTTSGKGGSRKLVVVVLVLAVLAGVGIAFALSRKSDDKNAAVATTTENAP